MEIFAQNSQFSEHVLSTIVVNNRDVEQLIPHVTGSGCDYTLPLVNFPCSVNVVRAISFSLFYFQGHGVLLCDDNTKYEGEFIGECLLSGKV